MSQSNSDVFDSAASIVQLPILFRTRCANSKQTAEVRAPYVHSSGSQSSLSHLTVPHRSWLNFRTTPGSSLLPAIRGTNPWINQVHTCHARNVQNVQHIDFQNPQKQRQLKRKVNNGIQWHYCFVWFLWARKRRAGVDSTSTQVESPTFVHRQLALLLALLYFRSSYYDMPICHDMPSHGLICTAYIVKTYPGKWLICSFSHSFSDSITVSNAFGSLIMQCSLNSFFKTLFRTLSLSTREMPHKSPALLTSNSHPCSPLHNSLPLQHRDLVAHLQRPSHYIWTPNWSEDQAAVNLRQTFSILFIISRISIVHIVHHCDWFLVEHTQSFCFSPISPNSHARSRLMHTYDWICFPAIVIEPSFGNIYARLCRIFLHWVHETSTANTKSWNPCPLYPTPPPSLKLFPVLKNFSKMLFFFV